MVRKNYTKIDYMAEGRSLAYDCIY